MEHYTKADKQKLFYLASPYSHDNSFVMQFRYELIIYTASILTKQGFRLIEPIGMCHSSSLRHEMPTGYEFWKTRDRGFIDVSDGIIVMKMPGWSTSVGVTDELEWAAKTGKPIYFIEQDEIITENIRREIFNDAIYSK